MVVTGKAYDMKSWGQCLSGHLPFAISVLKSAGLPASGLEERLGQEDEQDLFGACEIENS